MKAIGKCLHGLNDDRDEGKIYLRATVSQKLPHDVESERDC